MNDRRIAVVVEDDADVRGLLEGVLTQSGFEVYAAESGLDGVETVRRHMPSVITLDLGLPDIDGFEVARRVRQFSDSYIIMLTARGDELDTVEGFASGADDYLTKPFRPRELRARVNAMLRRPRADALTGSTAAAPAAAAAAPAASAAPENNDGETLTDGHLEHKGLELNSATRLAKLEGRPLELTRTEFDLLQAMLESGRRVRSKADLVRRLRAEDYDTGSYISDADERAVEVHMGNLRRKLGEDPRDPRWLKTVRGVGYQLAP